VTVADLAIIAALIFVWGAVSARLERTDMTAPILFTAAGLLLTHGPLRPLGIEPSKESVKLLAEATLALVLFSDASRVGLRNLRADAGLCLRLLGIGLPLTIATGTVIAVLLFTQLSWLEALVLAIVLAPTDAALGQAVVTDRRLPVRVRQGLNVESGLNDGICVPLLLIALAIAEADENAVTVHHAVSVIVEEIGWGLVGGIAAGALGASVLGFVERRRLVAHDWLQVIPLSAAASDLVSRRIVGIETLIAGGDDYEVLCTVPEHRVEAFAEAARRAGGQVTSIGMVVAGASAPKFIDGQGAELALERLSYSHF